MARASLSNPLSINELLLKWKRTFFNTLIISYYEKVHLHLQKTIHSPCHSRTDPGLVRTKPIPARTDHVFFVRTDTGLVQPESGSAQN
jgi:hypothetical protein